MPVETEASRFIQESETGIGESSLLQKIDIKCWNRSIAHALFNILPVSCTVRCWAPRCDELLLVTR